MKQKKLDKKLTFNKTTITNLNKGQMKAVAGGVSEPELCIFTEKDCSRTPCPVTWPGHTCIDC